MKDVKACEEVNAKEQIYPQSQRAASYETKTDAVKTKNHASGIKA